jgi:hypothetical protein
MVADLVDQAPAWQAAGAEHLAVWFGAIDGFQRRMRAGGSHAGVGGEVGRQT